LPTALQDALSFAKNVILGYLDLNINKNDNVNKYFNLRTGDRYSSAQNILTYKT
jgi:hypothetical protein